MEERKVPRHVAIILDGNGRWAKKRMLPRNAGHAAGSKNVEKICAAAWDMGIEYVTMYAFSTENWSRPKEEVDALMKLLHSYLKDCLKTSKKNNMQVRVIGDISKLDKDLQERIIELERVSAENTGLHFQVALNYGSRDEIKRSIISIANEVKEGSLLPEDITEDIISSHLDTSGIPDPDLMIRTSGEQRLSNYLLWQLAYAEFYFTDVLWPDFSKKDLQKAVEFYQSRDRRFGGVK
ncbi:MAG: isoprenyl transferase [Butyribacter sp.]|jgi:undecaprenyl diphosphate synthase|uniref:Isoprenyl transferase n=2 Tax=Butyribacter intestini TaxID=1703332 RepID=A0AAW3JVL1_9FIRM|nr:MULTISPECIES: isoprenyl transferase [Clostridia]KQC86400.1 UDP pyrophosphate synthase [Butyribacter intestini]RHT95154.1 isoprenyl transferase [Clostridium sp. AM27-31LB]RHU77506.1 isoprenyl transferase [Butyribacter intestini]UYJ39563.1 MAG: isoprenyl transferase [Lachnospiraceae bacterium]